jgi:ribosome-associated protein
VVVRSGRPQGAYGRHVATRIPVGRGVTLDPADLVWRTSRSGGPGGQHANTSDTRVEVILDLRRARSLSARQRSLAIGRAGPVLRATASDSRSQSRNRELALERLVRRLAAALRTDPVRRATRPTAGSRSERRRVKQRRSDIKRSRVRPRPDED